MYEGATPTKFGQFAVAEPPHFDRMQLHRGEPLREVSWPMAFGPLDQEDLIEQGIFTDKIVMGAARVDALGSCTAQSTTAHYGERLHVAGKDLTAAGLSATDLTGNEVWAIRFYHSCTSQTGDPAQEWPPTDCGSTGLYCCKEMLAQKRIADYKTATGAANLLSMLQAGSAIMGGPWFNSWMAVDSDGFVDGDGSLDALYEAVASGVAGGHETTPHTIVQLAQTSNGIELDKTIIEVRNSWSTSFGLSGDYRVHASTLQFLASYFDYKQFVV